MQRSESQAERLGGGAVSFITKSSASEHSMATGVSGSSSGGTCRERLALACSVSKIDLLSGRNSGTNEPGAMRELLFLCHRTDFICFCDYVTRWVIHLMLLPCQVLYFTFSYVTTLYPED